MSTGLVSNSSQPAAIALSLSLAICWPAFVTKHLE